MQKRRRRRVPRQKARDDGTGKEEFVVEIKVGLLTSAETWDQRQPQYNDLGTWG